MNSYRLVAADLLKGQTFAMKIRGNCMEPVLMPGDLVSVSTTSRYVAGDIILFQGHNDRLTAHRLLGRTISSRGPRLMTKPDSSSAMDGLLSANQILGKLTHNITQKRDIKVSIQQRLLCSVLLFKNSLTLAARKYKQFGWHLKE